MITNTYEKEFTTSNLCNSDLVIERVSINTDEVNIGSCLLLDAINNMQEGVIPDNYAPRSGAINDEGRKISKQSPMTMINQCYQTDYFNTVIPKTRKWRFYITDKEGNYITLKAPMFVSIHFSQSKSKDER